MAIILQTFTDAFGAYGLEICKYIFVHKECVGILKNGSMVTGNNLEAILQETCKKALESGLRSITKIKLGRWDFCHVDKLERLNLYSTGDCDVLKIKKSIDNTE